MESMRRSEANSSHHPNKVAVNSLPTESNKQSSGSSGSSSLNNNKLSFNQQQQQTVQSQQLKSNQQESQQVPKTSSSSESSSSSSTTSSSSSSGASTSSESKDTNFEYDDNEWDVGGIGDLIIDLDADIEKSSSTAAAAAATVVSTSVNPQSQQTSSHLSASLTGVTGGNSNNSAGGGGSGSTSNQILNAHDKSPSSASSSRSSSSPSSPTTASSSKSSNLSSLFAPIPLRVASGGVQQTQQTQQSSSTTSSSNTQKQRTSGNPPASFQSNTSNKLNSKVSSSKASANLKLQQPALLAQLNSKTAASDHTRFSSSSSSSTAASSNTTSSTTSASRNYQSSSNTSSTSNHSLQTDRHGKSQSNAPSAMSSQQSGGQGAGKTATKMSIDHQATLDKGLKMKIKRTKPGTKTSEAKHEIVKAEQNGTSASVEDNSISSNNSSSSSSSSSGKNKHSQNNSAPVQPVQPAPQPTKRGSSGHRRDKTREKTPHSRDKSDHGSSSGGGGGGSSNNGSSNSSNSSSSSNNANNASQNDRASNSCNCTHDMQVNGSQAPCTNVSCVRSRTPTGPVDSANSNSLSQRISGPTAGNQQTSGTSGNTPGANSSSSSNPNSSSHSAVGNNSSNHFSNNNSSSNVQSSSSGTPNAPGPPKDKMSSSNANSSGGGSGGHHQQSQPQQSSTAQVSNSASSSSSSSTSSSMSNHQQQSGQTHNSSSAVHNSNSQISSSGGSGMPQQSISATVHHTISMSSNCDDRSCSPPPKKAKCDPKDMIDICVGTSVGTITEPDCLGPCEPGTSVTLEGIVWHETEGGVLVVNVTWRGKTYVGTLLDCTRHDWAPPRFCDSPTEELDSRTPKGRGKRGRGAALTPDLSNFTETRSSVHSKLRNGAKGRGGRTVTTTGTATSTTTTSSTTTTATSSTTSVSSSNSSSTNSSNTPSTSPTAFLPPRPEKRKSKDESPSPVNGESAVTAAAPSSSSTQSSSGQTQSLVNPVTGLNVQITTKKCKTASPCAISPVLLECPEQDCSKKYKHANGLRYHQSHAHGSGSMDEDSLQLPESPRIAPPTTPSPAPATTPQPQIPTSNTTVAQVASPTVASPSFLTTPIPSTQSQPSTVTGGTPATGATGGLLTAIPQSVASSLPPTSTGTSVAIAGQIPQHTVAGGSITSGISGQALSQHQQQHPMHVSGVPGSGGLLSSNNQSIPEAGQPLLTQQQQQQQQSQAQQQQQPPQVMVANAPPRVDGPLKPSVLRFGSPSDNLSNNQNLLPGQGPPRPTPTVASMPPSSGPPNAQDGVGHQPPYSQSPASIQQGLSNNKPQSYGKQKKNRSKSPVLGEYDNSTSRDNVQSPAYSDISDDSTPVVDTEMTDKSQPPKHPDVKKVPEGAPPPIAGLGGYGMYPFYPQQQYMVPPEHQGPKQPVSQSTMPPASPADYNKSKDPPLDLMTKPAQPPNEPASKESNVPPQGPAGPGPQNPNKPIPQFYPYNYMTYQYNLEPSYGPISMVSEDNKLSSISNAPHSIKEERNKESPSPNEHGKMPGQMMPSKLMKTEPSVKEIKTEPSGHPMHPKEPPVQSIGPYPGMYQRHPVGVPPQPSHLSREEDMRRFYMYSDQRRQNLPNAPPSNVPPVTIKEEPPSPSQPPMQHSAASISQGQPMSQMSQPPQNPSSQSSQQQSASQQKSVKSSLSSSSSSSSSSGQKATNLVKDTKDDKDVKIKQEGQKPTMETQGPPPPPTSQYFLPQYLSNYTFDPGHPMYRNVLMSTSPYNAPPYHHLPMARFHAPEDLSRNTGPKALDVLQQAANMQYYGSHKIHELSERALKSPNSASKVSVSSPNVSQQNVSNTVSGSNIGPGGPGGMMQPSGPPGGPLNLQPPTGAMPPGMGHGGGVGGIGGPKTVDGKPGTDPSNKAGIGGGANDSRSPPPQRHVHTHHHTHVGLGYPMYTAPYGAAVLASQQAAAVAVINPFPPGPTK